MKRYLLFDHYYLNIILLLPAGNIPIESQSEIEGPVKTLWNHLYSNPSIDKFQIADLLKRNFGPFAPLYVR